MVPLRPAALFRSRWAALFYAAGVLWLAVDVSGGREPPPENAVSNVTDVDKDANLNALEAQVHAFEKLK